MENAKININDQQTANNLMKKILKLHSIKNIQTCYTCENYFHVRHTKLVCRLADWTKYCVWFKLIIENLCNVRYIRTIHCTLYTGNSTVLFESPKHRSVWWKKNDGDIFDRFNTSAIFSNVSYHVFIYSERFWMLIFSWSLKQYSVHPIDFFSQISTQVVPHPVQNCLYLIRLRRYQWVVNCFLCSSKPLIECLVEFIELKTPFDCIY